MNNYPTRISPAAALDGCCAFLFHAAKMVRSFMFSWCVTPEPEGESLEQIQHELGTR